MRLRVQQSLKVSFEKPARSLMLALKTMPRDHEGQVIVSWRIEPSIDGRLRAGEDAFGNREHLFQADGPIDELNILVDGVVDTLDTAGIVRGAREPLPPSIFLRQAGTTPEERAPLRAAAMKAEGDLARMHALMHAIAARSIRQAPDLPGQIQQQQAGTSSAGVVGQQGGPVSLPPLPSTDLAGLFVAVARDLAIPARMVRGAVAAWQDDDGHTLAAGDAHWAEAHIAGLGWVGFDPSRRLCPTPAHLRIAVGLSESDIVACRLAQMGGLGERVQLTTAIVEA